MVDQQYQAALEHLKFEGELLWQIFGAFLLAHTVFMAFLLQVLNKPLPANHPGGFWGSLVGLLLCLPWYSSFLRNSAYYDFRMAQARAAEPPTWHLLREAGQQFAEGECVTVDGKHHRQPWLARKLRA